MVVCGTNIGGGDGGGVIIYIEYIWMTAIKPLPTTCEAPN